jgi:hypothetical protein
MRAILVVITSALMYPAAADAQWSSNNITLNADLSDLRIVLVGPAPCRSVIGMKAKSETQSAISIAEMVPTFKNYHGVALPALPFARPVPEGRISYQNQTLRIVCSGKPDSVIDVFVATKGVVNLSLSTPTVPNVEMRVQDGVIITDGVAANVRPEGLHHLVLQSSSQFTPAPTMSYGKLMNANVTLADAKNHVRTYEQPRLRIPQNGGVGVLTLEIDESGHVAAVSGASVKMLDGEAVDMIRAWVFEPFSLDGKPARVVAAIPFHIDAAGTIMTALDPSAHVF